MRHLAFLFALLFAFPSFAVTTQPVKQARVRYAIQHLQDASQMALVFADLEHVLWYDTYAELAAATPTEGTFGYAVDTNAMYYRSGSSWVGINTTGNLVGTYGGTFGNTSDLVWVLTEGTEDLTFTESSNLWTLGSTTSATIAFTPAVGFTGDITLSGGATALTFDAAASSVVVPNNSATALIVGSSGMLNLLTLDTRTGVEKVMVTGTTGYTSLHNDVGLTLLDEPVTLGGGVGALTFTGSSGSVLLKDATAASLDIGSAGRTNLLRFDTTDGAEKVVITGVTTKDALTVPIGTVNITEGVVSPIVATAYDVVRFCGNLANANTPKYMKPILAASYGTDMTYGAAGCDGNDSDTKTTADLSLDAPFAYYPVAMTCVASAITANVWTFQLYDDGNAVTAMTCNFTSDGSNPKQCTVRDQKPTAIAASSQITVGSVATSVDGSAIDAECRLFIAY